jgi:hypothetical protein
MYWKISWVGEGSLLIGVHVWAGVWLDASYHTVAVAGSTILPPQNTSRSNENLKKVGSITLLAVRCRKRHYTKMGIFSHRWLSNVLSYGMLRRVVFVTDIRLKKTGNEITKLHKRADILVTGRGGLYGCLISRIPHFIRSRFTEGDEILSLKRRPSFTPRKIFCHSFLLQAE